MQDRYTEQTEWLSLLIMIDGSVSRAAKRMGYTRVGLLNVADCATELTTGAMKALVRCVDDALAERAEGPQDMLLRYQRVVWERCRRDLGKKWRRPFPKPMSRSARVIFDLEQLLSAKGEMELSRIQHHFTVGKWEGKDITKSLIRHAAIRLRIIKRVEGDAPHQRSYWRLSHQQPGGRTAGKKNFKRVKDGLTEAAEMTDEYLEGIMGRDDEASLLKSQRKAIAEAQSVTARVKEKLRREKEERDGD